MKKMLLGTMSQLLRDRRCYVRLFSPWNCLIGCVSKIIIIVQPYNKRATSTSEPVARVKLKAIGNISVQRIPSSFFFCSWFKFGTVNQRLRRHFLLSSTTPDIEISSLTTLRLHSPSCITSYTVRTNKDKRTLLTSDPNTK